MRRLFIDDSLREIITVGGEDARHLMYSMRAKKGDTIVVADKDGRQALMEMVDFSAREITLRLLEEVNEESKPHFAVTLAQCVLKADKMDMVVQKATELGVSCIVPIISHNVVVRLDTAKAAARLERWQKIAREAAGQCGRDDLPKILPVTTLSAFMSDLTYGTLIFCCETEREHSLRSRIRLISHTDTAVLIGAEGGFTPQETEMITAAGGLSVTMGKRILRAETAAVAALSILQYEKGDM